jgi:hypothetical protein
VNAARNDVVTGSESSKFKSNGSGSSSINRETTRSADVALKTLWATAMALLLLDLRGMMFYRRWQMYVVVTVQAQNKRRICIASKLDVRWSMVNGGEMSS